MSELTFSIGEVNAAKPVKQNYDLVIIGGGPAGLTAAIYSARAKLSTLVVEKSVVGGEVETTDLIENYPGFPEGVSGHVLADRMRKQAERFGAQIAFGQIEKLDLQADSKTIKFNGQNIETKAVIIATGTSPKKLQVPGEEKFIGAGISFCATCDAPIYAGEDIAVVGCGNSGLQEGLFILKYVKSIHFIEFLPEIKAEKILVDRVKQHENVFFHLNHEVVAVKGEDRVQSIQIRDRSSHKMEEIPVHGIFIYIGLLPNTELFRDIINLDSRGYIETNENLQTSIPGVFAAGDVRDKNLYQITTAVSDGSLAAVFAEKYLDNLKR